MRLSVIFAAIFFNIAIADTAQELKWVDVSTDKTVEVNGLAWFEENEGRFIRLPLARKEEITKNAWAMSLCPSTARVRFKTDSPTLIVKVDHGMSSTNKEDFTMWQMSDVSRLSMWHMASGAVSGIDIYIGEPGSTSYWTTTRPQKADGEYEHTYFKDWTREMREFTLYLPAYAELKSLKIGVAQDSQVLKPTAYAHEKPIVVYGTSITQSGCSSRGSNGFVAIMGRRLNSDVINLGFSGSGCGEPEIAQMISEIDASMYIVDSVANMNEKFMDERFETFVMTLRNARPNIPIVLMTKIHYAAEAVSASERARYSRIHKALYETYDKLKAQGDKYVYIFDTGKIIPYGGDHPTVDGVHLTDTGYYMIADSLVPFVKEILNAAE